MKEYIKEIRIKAFSVIPIAADWAYDSTMSPIFAAFCRYWRGKLLDNFDGASHSHNTGIWEVTTKDGKKWQYELATTKDVPLHVCKKYPFVEPEEKRMLKEVVCAPLGCQVTWITYIDKKEILKELDIQ